MSLNKNFLNAESDEVHSSELPNGGARVIEAPLDDSVPYAGTEPSIGDEDLQLDQVVPMLMESVDEPRSEQDVAVEPLPDLPASETPERAAEQLNEQVEASAAANTSEHANEDTDERGVEVQVTATAGITATDSDQQEVFVINVAAKADPFKGPDLLHILLACDLRFGEMSIFHRHEEANGSGAVQFSMANSVQPGVFDLDSIDDFSTPSVSFFMSVPGADNPMQAFDAMVETAQCLVKNLGGEMRDESRSVMTLQTLEHCRQRIRDSERRQLTRSA